MLKVCQCEDIQKFNEKVLERFRKLVCVKSSNEIRFSIWLPRGLSYDSAARSQTDRLERDTTQVRRYYANQIRQTRSYHTDRSHFTNHNFFFFIPSWFYLLNSNVWFKTKTSKYITFFFLPDSCPKFLAAMGSGNTMHDLKLRFVWLINSIILYYFMLTYYHEHVI